MKLLVFLLFFVMVKAQNSNVIQFIGNYVSKDEESRRDFCVTKYCLLDANYLFSGATQNKSVRPCDDFKEFALGTFVKYKSVSDRDRYVGFNTDLSKVYLEQMRKVLASPVNKNDNRVTKGIKQLFSKCVTSNYVRQNGVREIREYARHLGLTFYPESDQRDFSLKKHMEQEPIRVLLELFNTVLSRKRHSVGTNDTDILTLQHFEKTFMLQQLSGYTDMLNDMNFVQKNTSLDQQKMEFIAIANKQIEFYNLLVS